NSGGPTVTNTANVTGGGDGLSHIASGATVINSPLLAITKSHNGDPFTVGQAGTYTIRVDNTGKVATSGTVSVQDFLPNGLSATTATGTGWNCNGTTFVNCTRSDALAPGSSYPAISLTVSVNGGAPSVTDSASVSGGGDPNFHSVQDLTN